MRSYYATSTQQNSNGTINTDLLLSDIKTDSTTSKLRAYIQKLQAGSYAAVADNAMRLRLHRLATFGTYASGAAIVPAPVVPDAPPASAVASTLPTIGSATLSAVAVAQLVFNQRGTGIWAALNPDEAIGIQGPNNATNGIIVVDSQSTGISIPFTYKMYHSE